ncbi:MAG: TrkA C-terminal domain-containing protein, partial [Rhodocyclaceae bacterium]|nr:TrkA C-terminal domain-containing protein [Rhodocyclaceae bacterium]
GAIVRRTHDPEIIYKDGLPSREYIDRVIIPHHDTVIESDDHVIVFCTRKREVAQVEKLFQVGFHFL